MSLEHGPSACAPHCISCGEAIHDDGPEQSEAWLASMCPECHNAEFQAEADSVELYDARNADRSREYEPRSAF